MNAENIIKFRDSLRNLSTEELEKKKSELQDQIAKMIMDSDIIMQIAIIDSQLKEKAN